MLKYSCHFESFRDSTKHHFNNAPLIFSLGEFKHGFLRIDVFYNNPKFIKSIIEKKSQEYFDINPTNEPAHRTYIFLIERWTSFPLHEFRIIIMIGISIN